MKPEVRALNEMFGADIRAAMRAARLSRELAAADKVLHAGSAHEHCAEVVARINEQRHAAHHELTVAQQRIEQLEIQAYRRGTAIICLLLALAAAMVVALWR